MSKDTKALLRARFAELRDARDKVEAKMTPLNEKMKQIRADASVAEAEITEKKRPLRAELSEIDAELAAVNRGLMGKTGG